MENEFKIGDLVDVRKNGQHWFRGQCSKVLDKGLVLNDIAGIKEGTGFNPDWLAGSYLPFETNVDVVEYKFTVVQ